MQLFYNENINEKTSLTKEENKPLRNSSYGVSDKEELIKHIEDIITKYESSEL